MNMDLNMDLEQRQEQHDDSASIQEDYSPEVDDLVSNHNDGRPDLPNGPLENGVGANGVASAPHALYLANGGGSLVNGMPAHLLRTHGRPTLVSGVAPHTLHQDNGGHGLVNGVPALPIYHANGAERLVNGVAPDTLHHANEGHGLVNGTPALPVDHANGGEGLGNGAPADLRTHGRRTLVNGVDPDTLHYANEGHGLVNGVPALPVDHASGGEGLLNGVPTDLLQTHGRRTLINGVAPDTLHEINRGRGLVSGVPAHLLQTHGRPRLENGVAPETLHNANEGYGLVNGVVATINGQLDDEPVGLQETAQNARAQFGADEALAQARSLEQQVRAEGERERQQRQRGMNLERIRQELEAELAAERAERATGLALQPADTAARRAELQETEAQLQQEIADDRRRQQEADQVDGMTGRQRRVQEDSVEQRRHAMQQWRRHQAHQLEQSIQSQLWREGPQPRQPSEAELQQQRFEAWSRVRGLQRGLENRPGRTPRGLIQRPGQPAGRLGRVGGGSDPSDPDDSSDSSTDYRPPRRGGGGRRGADGSGTAQGAFPYHHVVTIWRDPEHPLHKYYAPQEMPNHLFQCCCPNRPGLHGPLNMPADRQMAICQASPCLAFNREWIVYGKIGAGRYGTVFAVRERNPPEGSRPRHCAAKIQMLNLPLGHEDSPMVIMQPNEQPNGRNAVHREALKLWFARDSDGRLSRVRESYAHGPFVYIVMDLVGVDVSERMDTIGSAPRWHRAPKVTGHNASSLIGANKRPRLSEREACRVLHSLLGALVALNDRRMIHCDMHPGNILVGDDLAVQLIDFDVCHILTGPESQSYDGIWLSTAIEHQMAPEVLDAMEEQRPGSSYDGSDPADDWLDAPDDLMRRMLWKFGVAAYETVHGLSPWVFPEEAHHNINCEAPSTTDTMAADNVARAEADVAFRRERRRRMREDPLPVDAERLSIDCQDVLTAMLRRDPADRPTLSELCTFPWFQGWHLDDARGAPVTFKRPALEEDDVDPEALNAPRKRARVG
ncbi:MAG: hypothetical protein M1832_005106 [Thelocarpon impressellum]|nr:MAG: hypothetical protein M1832_005106 [Thelocarpon impressellum]